MPWNNARWAALLPAILVIVGCAATPDPGRQADRTGSLITPAFRSDYQQVVAMMDQDPVQARQALRRLHEARPELTGPLLNLCILAYRNGEQQAARNCFDKVLATSPEQPDALNHLGVMARQDGEFGLAEDYYRRALKAHPEHLPSLRNLGILMDLYRGQHREALRLYEQYQALLPEPDPVVAQWVADLKNRL